MPALFTRMSIRPNSARVRSVMAARSVRRVTSVGTTLTRRPSPFTSAAVRSAPARSSSATTRSAPIRASSSAVARPIPRPAPVTIATCPVSSMTSASGADRPRARRRRRQLVVQRVPGRVLQRDGGASCRGRSEEHTSELQSQSNLVCRLLLEKKNGLDVAGKRHWMHVTCTPTLTHYHVDASRGQAALEAIGILPPFTGIAVHDGWRSYFLYNCEHAVCIVHLLRDLVFLAEQGIQWAADLKTLLLDMKEATEQAREQGKHWLDPLEVVDWEAQFLRLLDEGDQADPRATAPPGQRGRGKQR